MPMVVVILSDYQKELDVHAYRENYLKEQDYHFVTQRIEDTIFASMFLQRKASIGAREKAVINLASTA